MKFQSLSSGVAVILEFMLAPSGVTSCSPPKSGRTCLSIHHVKCRRPTSPSSAPSRDVHNTQSLARLSSICCYCRAFRCPRPKPVRTLLLASRFMGLPDSSSCSQRVVSKRSPRSVNCSLHSLSVVSFPVLRRQRSVDAFVSSSS